MPIIMCVDLLVLCKANTTAYWAWASRLSKFTWKHLTLAASPQPWLKDLSEMSDLRYAVDLFEKDGLAACS